MFDVLFLLALFVPPVVVFVSAVALAFTSLRHGEARAAVLREHEVVSH